MTNMLSNRKFCVALLTGITLMSTACSKEPTGVSANMTVYNHMVTGVASYGVKLSTGAAIDAGFVAPGEGGGAVICCLTLPLVWTPNLTATVKKNVFDKDRNTVSTFKTVPVPRYASPPPGRFVVHFLVDGNIKVFATRYLLGHAKYPLRGQEAELIPGTPIEIIWK